jgi:hypothetical protein
MRAADSFPSAPNGSANFTKHKLITSTAIVPAHDEKYTSSPTRVVNRPPAYAHALNANPIAAPPNRACVNPITNAKEFVTLANIPRGSTALVALAAIDNAHALPSPPRNVPFAALAATKSNSNGTSTHTK